MYSLFLLEQHANNYAQKGLPYIKVATTTGGPEPTTECNIRMQVPMTRVL